MRQFSRKIIRWGNSERLRSVRHDENSCEWKWTSTFKASPMLAHVQQFKNYFPDEKLWKRHQLMINWNFLRVLLSHESLPLLLWFGFGKIRHSTKVNFSFLIERRKKGTCGNGDFETRSKKNRKIHVWKAKQDFRRKFSHYDDRLRVNHHTWTSTIIEAWRKIYFLLLHTATGCRCRDGARSVGKWKNLIFSFLFWSVNVYNFSSLSTCKDRNAHDHNDRHTIVHGNPISYLC